MATIRKRGNRYHVQIRRRGQSITRTFDRLATAKSWIPKIEGDIERHLCLIAKVLANDFSGLGLKKALFDHE